jgi:hypothetical protein
VGKSIARVAAGPERFLRSAAGRRAKTCATIIGRRSFVASEEWGFAELCRHPPCPWCGIKVPLLLLPKVLSGGNLGNIGASIWWIDLGEKGLKKCRN